VPDEVLENNLNTENTEGTEETPFDLLRASTAGPGKDYWDRGLPARTQGRPPEEVRICEKFNEFLD